MINLYRSVKSASLNQAFGYNLSVAKLAPDGKPIRPYEIKSIEPNEPVPAGYVRFYKLLGMEGHNGIDWGTYHGEPVYFCATAGDLSPLSAVCYAEIDEDGGKGVDIIFRDPDTGEYYQLKEWHLKDQAIHDGQTIQSGDLIGWADSTGASSGDHLHEGLKPLNSGKTEDKKFAGNGYTGAVDPANYPNIRSYQADSFILDALKKKQILSLAQRVRALLFQLLNMTKGRI